MLNRMLPFKLSRLGSITMQLRLMEGPAQQMSQMSTQMGQQVAATFKVHVEFCVVLDCYGGDFCRTA